MTACAERFPNRGARALLANRALLTSLTVALLWIVASLATPGFGAFGHLRYLVELAAVTGLVGVAQTLVVISGGIDLSVGAIVTVTAVGVPLLAVPGDSSGAIAVVGIVAVATTIGLLNGLGVAYLRVHPMIMTLAMATFLQGALILIAGGTAVSAENPLLFWLGSARPAGIPAGVLLWIAVSALALILLHATPLGPRIYALGANPLAARLSGVDIGLTTLVVYAVAGFASGLAGVLILAMNGQGYVGIGDPYVQASIAAVVLGGTSILGGSGAYAGHHSRRDPVGDDHRADHRRQRLAGLAQHPVRLVDPRAPVAVGTRGASAMISRSDRRAARCRKTAPAARRRRIRRRSP